MVMTQQDISCKRRSRESSKEVLGKKAVHGEMLEHIIPLYEEEGEIGVMLSTASV